MLKTVKSRERLMNLIYTTLTLGSLGVMISLITKSAFFGIVSIFAIYGLSQALLQFVTWVYDGER